MCKKCYMFKCENEFRIWDNRGTNRYRGSCKDCEKEYFEQFNASEFRKNYINGCRTNQGKKHPVTFSKRSMPLIFLNFTYLFQDFVSCSL